MEHFIPDETSVKNVNGVIDMICVSKEFQPTEVSYLFFCKLSLNFKLDLDNESDVVDTVEMLKAIMATERNASKFKY